MSPVYTELASLLQWLEYVPGKCAVLAPDLPFPYTYTELMTETKNEDVALTQTTHVDRDDCEREDLALHTQPTLNHNHPYAHGRANLAVVFFSDLLNNHKQRRSWVRHADHLTQISTGRRCATCDG